MGGLPPSDVPMVTTNGILAKQIALNQERIQCESGACSSAEVS
ncbi:hypothetical protein F0726_00244 [Acidithiobacillus caldus]|jgi:hypothetical protein|nr:hypothetical protein F0726_00244 [Acidithiobacillus caldus]